jgi:TRAP-type C4-dicarboxylate transport system permease small subunit
MTTPSYDEIRQMADERYRRWTLFICHFVIAALCLMMVWFSSLSRTILPEIITIIWVSLVLIQGIRIFISQHIERAVEREWRQLHTVEVVEEETPDRKALQGV